MQLRSCRQIMVVLLSLLGSMTAMTTAATAWATSSSKLLSSAGAVGWCGLVVSPYRCAYAAPGGTFVSGTTSGGTAKPKINCGKTSSELQCAFVGVGDIDSFCIEAMCDRLGAGLLSPLPTVDRDRLWIASFQNPKPLSCDWSAQVKTRHQTEDYSAGADGTAGYVNVVAADDWANGRSLNSQTFPHTNCQSGP
jgi:hypothetical protein